MQTCFRLTSWQQIPSKVHLQFRWSIRNGIRNIGCNNEKSKSCCGSEGWLKNNSRFAVNQFSSRVGKSRATVLSIFRKCIKSAHKYIPVCSWILKLTGPGLQRVNDRLGVQVESCMLSLSVTMLIRSLEARGNGAISTCKWRSQESGLGNYPFNVTLTNYAETSEEGDALLEILSNSSVSHGSWM